MKIELNEKQFYDLCEILETTEFNYSSDEIRCSFCGAMLYQRDRTYSDHYEDCKAQKLLKLIRGQSNLGE